MLAKITKFNNIYWQRFGKYSYSWWSKIDTTSKKGLSSSTYRNLSYRYLCAKWHMHTSFVYIYMFPCFVAVKDRELVRDWLSKLWYNEIWGSYKKEKKRGSSLWTKMESSSSSVKSTFKNYLESSHFLTT